MVTLTLSYFSVLHEFFLFWLVFSFQFPSSWFNFKCCYFSCLLSYLQVSIIFNSLSRHFCWQQLVTTFGWPFVFMLLYFLIVIVLFGSNAQLVMPAGWLAVWLDGWLSGFRFIMLWAWVGWLTYWLTDWLAIWLTDGLMYFIDWWLTSVTDWIADQWIKWITDQLTGWLAGWLADWPTDWVNGYLINDLMWTTDPMTSLVDRQNDWPGNWVTDQLIRLLTDWLTDWSTDWRTSSMTEHHYCMLKAAGRL